MPPKVASSEAFDDVAEATLFPQEEAMIARSVDKRRREFSTVRLCARRAMADLGLPSAPVLPGLRGSPQWPGGVVGSMTHCDGYRAAALAYATHLRTIGIDAEPHDELPDGVLDAVALPQEKEQLAALKAASPGKHWDRLLFSAKESVYKAWFPLARRWLGFEEAEITFNPARRSFTVRLLVSGPEVDGSRLTGFTGRWKIDSGLVLTAIAL
nr:4'-phosphopantetheinyl transferase superfamily protein [Planosporangium flavigriseum]